MNKGIYLIIIISLFGCNSRINETGYLKKVSENLDQIKSATYLSTRVASAPGDTAKFTEPYEAFFRIFINPSDSLVGSASATFSAEDTTIITDFYDGNVRGKVNWDKQYVKIDSFKHHPYPFRLVHYPFYTKINEIIKYTLTTTDSIQTDLIDYGDSVYFSLRIINRHVYFHIKPIVIQNEYIPEDEISRFDIWFDKRNNMPYRMRSKWHHTTFFQSCSHARFNTTEDITFDASEYFPENFEIRQFKRTERKTQNNMLGLKAPDWTLKDIYDKEVNLSDLDSKVLLVQFTGIGCGPCHSSIPFLKQFVDDYKDEDFEFLSIETWSKNVKGMKRYVENNGIDFRFLCSTDEVKQSYQVSSVPIFFVLDKDRIIRKVINGYGKGKTDKEISDAIDEFL